jgi:hypothetical protein
MDMISQLYLPLPVLLPRAGASAGFYQPIPIKGCQRGVQNLPILLESQETFDSFMTTLACAPHQILPRLGKTFVL